MLSSLDPQPSRPLLTSTPAQNPSWSSRPTLIPTSPSRTQVSACSPATLLSTQWAWKPEQGPRPSSSVTQTVDDFLVEKWCKYFPSKPPLGQCVACVPPLPPSLTLHPPRPSFGMVCWPIDCGPWQEEDLAGCPAAGVHLGHNGLPGAWAHWGLYNSRAQQNLKGHCLLSSS